MYFVIFYLVFLFIFFIISLITIKRILFLSYPGDISKQVILLYIAFCLFITLTTFLSLKNINWSFSFDFWKNFKIF